MSSVAGVRGARRRLLGAVASAALLAGCGGGGGSAASFRHAYAAVSARYHPIGQQLAQTLVGAPSLSDQILASRLAGFSGQFQDAATGFSALHPPASVRPVMTNYLRLLDRARQAIDALAAAARAHDAAAAKPITQALVSDLQSAAQAKRGLDAAAGVHPGGG